MKFIIYLLLLLDIVNQVHGYNILFFATFGARSHKNVMDPVIQELATQGHKVVFITSTNDKKDKGPNIREIYVEEADKIMANEGFNFFKGTYDNEEFTKILFDSACEIINASYSHPEVREFIRNPRNLLTNTPVFDVVVIDASYNEFATSLAYHIGVPVVLLSPSIMFLHIGWSMNIPIPFSYIPSAVVNISTEMSFTQRASNAFHSILLINVMLNKIFPRYDSMIQKFIPNSPPMKELANKVSFFITNDHLAVGPVVPTMPYYVQLGGIHCKPAKKLPQDLENFMQNAGKDGVIYFSLGSFTQGANMPKAMTEKIVKAFAQVPQKVLWKNEIAVEGISKNVKLIKWAPQSDLLAHPNLKLFITHFGGLSTQEAVYHGRPVLGFPLSVDQLGYMANSVQRGFAEYLDWRTFTVDDLVHKIKLLIENESYRINAEKASKIFKDYNEHPAKTAAYWIEYITRHNGAPHLKSGAEHLNIFQYFLLDVIGAILAIGLCLLGVLLFILKQVFRLLFGKRQKSSANHGKIKKQKGN